MAAPWRRSESNPDLDPELLTGQPLADTHLGVGEDAAGARQRFGVVFWASTAWIAAVVLTAVLAPVLPLDPTTIDPVHRLLGAGSRGHVLGTDTLGRDLLARIVFGSRVSLVVGVSSVAIGLAAGTVVGMVAGYLRGWTERIVMWAVDVLLSFPALVLLISIVAFEGRSLLTISVALGFLSIPVYARLTRAHTLGVGEREFITAAHAVGMSRWRIMRREIVPNVLPPVLSYGLIAVGVVIVVEGSLSFLGLSVSAPTPSWGGLIAEGQTFLSEDPAVVLLPSAVLCLTVLALNLVGDTLRRRHEFLGVSA